MIAGRTVWVVIPAYQEERLISAVLRGVPPEVDHIVVVDDASTDGTAQSAGASRDQRTEVVRHERNRGVGAAICTGYARFLECCTDPAALCVVMAGDNQMDPADLEGLVRAAAEGGAYAKGNRFCLHSARRDMPRVRWVGNVALTVLTRISSGLWHVTDSQCGYTAISRADLARLDLQRLYPRYGFPNDMLLQLARRGVPVVDVPVRAVYGGERSKIRLLRVAPRIAMLLGLGLLQRRVSWRSLCVLLLSLGAVTGFIAAALQGAQWVLPAIGLLLLSMLTDAWLSAARPCACSH